jgi:hypothetical protein
MLCKGKLLGHLYNDWLTDYSEEDADELYAIRLRLSKLLKKQEPIESYFDRLSVQGHAMREHQSPRVPRFPDRICTATLRTQHQDMRMFSRHRRLLDPMLHQCGVVSV